MTAALAITEIAPAKVNLFLHVGPVRRDRLHALESLFVFTDDGDRVSAAPSRNISLAITGPFARELAPFPIESNLVWRAAHALKAAAGVSVDKNASRRAQRTGATPSGAKAAPGGRSSADVNSLNSFVITETTISGDAVKRQQNACAARRRQPFSTRARILQVHRRPLREGRFSA